MSKESAARLGVLMQSALDEGLPDFLQEEGERTHSFAISNMTRGLRDSYRILHRFNALHQEGDEKRVDADAIQRNIPDHELRNVDATYRRVLRDSVEGVPELTQTDGVMSFSKTLHNVQSLTEDEALGHLRDRWSLAGRSERREAVYVSKAERRQMAQEKAIGIPGQNPESLTGTESSAPLDDDALSAFLSSKPHQATSQMSKLGFTKSDQAGMYLIKAIEAGDTDSITAIQNAGVNLSTRMSPSARHASFGAEIGQKEASFIHILAAAGDDGVSAHNLMNPAIKIADIDVKDGDGNTALHLAAAHASKDHVKAWLSKGADVSTRNADGMTPSMMAGINGRNENTATLESAAVAGRQNRCSEAAARLHATRSASTQRRSRPQNRDLDIGD